MQLHEQHHFLFQGTSINNVNNTVTVSTLALSICTIPSIKLTVSSVPARVGTIIPLDKSVESTLPE